MEYHPTLDGIGVCECIGVVGMHDGDPDALRAY